MYETLKQWYYAIRSVLNPQIKQTRTHEKRHVFLTQVQVTNIETLLLLDNATDPIIKAFNTSPAVVSRIRQGKHRFSSDKYKATIKDS